jgi:hypothetical protein
MIRLIYLSTAVEDFSQSELEELLEKSRKNNQPKGITGLLVIKGRTFIQCLEGEESVIRELFEKIEKDDRHKDVMILEEDEDIQERYFPSWDMGFKNIANLTNIESEMLKDFTFDDMQEAPKIFKKFVEIF